MSSTVQYSDSQKLELSTATEFGAGVRLPDSWDDAAPVPMSEEELNACLVPAEFTEGDVEIAKRVLHRLLASVTAMADGMEKWLEGRPTKNEQPEIDGLIRGLARLWCAAFKVPIAHIRYRGAPAALLPISLRPVPSYSLAPRRLASRSSLASSLIGMKRKASYPDLPVLIAL
ncbi:hypothetical protein NKI46_09935 [Mesorhizobium sp. M0615]|uniref:hypothetical protein n=1 Tax=unclassified Mesorhizobium TaxID=325217 RepID=UPI0003CF26B4|nr:MULTISPECIES: hypothetical protein [unclassified Mesorhizobium]ESY36598.1 hypothetical protein X748_11985 [Mesorhizobium sp. LNJC386A00]